jgi:hypothetical protein
MKIKDIIVERNLKAGKVPARYKQASTGLHTFSDAERANSDYTHYRLGLYLAMSDGKNHPHVDQKTFYGKKHTAHPYTPIEAEMLKRGYKSVGADHKDLNKGNLKSMEPDSNNKSSPVAKKKKNKYGV